MTQVQALKQEPRIIRSVEGSVTAHGIYCLFDNQPRVMLARHLAAKYDMTPERYREVCGLPAEYPMVALGYKSEKAFQHDSALRHQRKSGKPRLSIVGKDFNPADHPPIVRSAKGSVTENLVYCLLDGEGTAFPATHVFNKFGMGWADYLHYCGLPFDYPCIAPYYGGSRKFIEAD